MAEVDDLKKLLCNFYLFVLGALRGYPPFGGSGKAEGFEARGRLLTVNKLRFYLPEEKEWG
jgi:hypothetical protein